MIFLLNFFLILIVKLINTHDTVLILNNSFLIFQKIEYNNKKKVLI